MRRRRARDFRRRNLQPASSGFFHARRIRAGRARQRRRDLPGSADACAEHCSWQLRSGATALAREEWQLVSGFDSVFTTTLALEGEYSDDPNDSGGATRYGVTERVARANGYTGPMRELPLADARRIAKSQY